MVRPHRSQQLRKRVARYVDRLRVWRAGLRVVQHERLRQAQHVRQQQERLV